MRLYAVAAAFPCHVSYGSALCELYWLLGERQKAGPDVQLVLTRCLSDVGVDLGSQTRKAIATRIETLCVPENPDMSSRHDISKTHRRRSRPTCGANTSA